MRCTYRATGSRRATKTTASSRHAREITVDGKRTVFADQAVDEIGWAPVTEPRRVPNGAVVQLMVRGKGTVRIPATGLPASVALVAQGPTPGSRGADVPFRFEDGTLVFEITPQLNGRWIYVVPKETPR